jgi:hypothetical protein
MTTQDIKFKAGGHSHALGNFAAGDIARGIPEALARHLVEEANAADYLQPVKAAEPSVVPAESPAKRTRKQRTED